MANFEVLALDEATPQIRAPGSGDGYTMPRPLTGASNILNIRNSTNPQTLNVFNTYSNESNYENGYIKWDASVFKIGTEKAGTGVGRTLQLDSAASIHFNAAASYEHRFMINGTIEWRLNQTSFYPYTDNSRSIGASASRVLNFFRSGYEEVSEMTAPAAPAANKVRIYAQDNGAGKTQLMAIFASGAAQQLAIEP